MSAPARRAQLGFTLIEVLVALALMALVSLISWRGLASVSSARDWIESQAEDTDAIVRSLGQLGRDVELSYDGPVFDPVGGDTVALSAGVRLLRRPAAAPCWRSCARIRTAPACGSACTGACVPTACGVPAAPRPRGPLPPVGDGALLLPGVRGMTLRVWIPGTGWPRLPAPRRPPPRPASKSPCSAATRRPATLFARDGAAMIRPIPPRPGAISAAPP